MTPQCRAARSALLAAVVLLAGATSGIWLPPLWRLLAPETLSAAADGLRMLGSWAPAVSLALMVAQSVIVPLPGSLVAAANGMLFGVWLGSLLSWVGGVGGAIATYLLGARFRGWVKRRWGQLPYGERLEQLGSTHGFWVVLVARLTPLVSLDFVGYLAGAAHMPFRHYLVANLIGIAPGMVVYTVLGHDLAYARNATWRAGAGMLLLVALLLLGRRFFRQR